MTFMRAISGIHLKGQEVELPSKGFLTVPDRAAHPAPCLSPLSAGRRKDRDHSPYTLLKLTYLHALAVFLPDFSTRALELSGLLLCEFGPLLGIRSRGECWLQIAFEPRVEASVVLALERCALIVETLRHARTA